MQTDGGRWGLPGGWLAGGWWVQWGGGGRLRRLWRLGWGAVALSAGAGRAAAAGAAGVGWGGWAGWAGWAGWGGWGGVGNMGRLRWGGRGARLWGEGLVHCGRGAGQCGGGPVHFVFLQMICRFVVVVELFCR